MKFFLLLSLLMSSAFAHIDDGHYVLDTIECSDGTTLNMGGKFMTYNLTLDVTGNELKMIARVQSNKWAPFKVNCTQVNLGKFSYTGVNQYEGYLDMVSAECNANIWVGILEKQKFGVEEQGTFDYEVNGNKLKISNKDTITRYSCGKTGAYPIYFYTKK